MSRVLIVTGGSRGIGAAICRLAGAAGYAVAVNFARDAAAAARVVGEIEAGGGRAIAVGADVSVEAEIAGLFEATETAFGPVTHLVNNAGITGPAGRLEEMSSDTLRRVIDVNVLGAILCARMAVQRMSTRRGGAGGVIVNISSSAVANGAPDVWVWYAATKAALETFTIGLGREVAGDGIRVAAVAPGFTATDILANLGDGIDKLAALIPLGRAAEPEEIAKAVMFLLSDDASYITGSVLRVTGGR